MKKHLLFFFMGLCLGGACIWGQHVGVRPSVPLAAKVPVEAAPIEPSEIRIQEWNWTEIENPDYSILASNLRNVLCPDSTIDDLLRARINRKFSILMLENPMSKYWETSEERKERRQKLAALNRQKSELLQNLGLATINGDSKPTAKAGLFSPEKMAEIEKITQKYPQQVLPPNPTPEEYDEVYNNRRARLEYLAQVLTPDELNQYRLTQDSNVSVVSKLLRAIDGTPQEISNCAFVFDFAPSTMINGSFSPDIDQALIAGLGADRFAQLQAAFSPANVSFSQFVMMTDVTPDEINQLQQLRQQHLGYSALQNSVNQLLGPELGTRYMGIVGTR